MFIPLSDTNPLREIKLQYVTIGLVLTNVVVFLLQLSPLPPTIVSSFGVIPVELLGSEAVGELSPLPTSTGDLPEWATLFTYMFLHADFFHLLGNMLFLWVFGDNVEDAMGHFNFLVFYLLCGVGAGLAHAGMMPGSQATLIGASGAVAGVIAAYLLMHPNVRVYVLAFKVLPMEVTALVVLGVWVVTQIVMVMMPETGPVAWWAHIGGLVMGAILVLFMRKPNFPLFDGKFS